MKASRQRLQGRARPQEAQIGLWVGLADPYVAELPATTGFDWLLIDGEHAPNDVRSALAQLQAIAPYPVSGSCARPGDTALIKQYLDLGAQTLLVPMVDSAEQAQQIVAATRYRRAACAAWAAPRPRLALDRVDGIVQHADEEIWCSCRSSRRPALANVRHRGSRGRRRRVHRAGRPPASMGQLGDPSARRAQGHRRRHRRGPRRRKARASWPLTGTPSRAFTWRPARRRPRRPPDRHPGRGARVLAAAFGRGQAESARASADQFCCWELPAERAG